MPSTREVCSAYYCYLSPEMFLSVVQFSYFGYEINFVRNSPDLKCRSSLVDVFFPGITFMNFVPF